jgi:asparagine synthase (glutamine-hydrolysing)
MPGIAGLVTRMPRERAAAELRRMLGVMRHERFYAIRTWIDEDLGVYVGWTARQGSFSDAPEQPNETGDLVLVFSGEEFSPPDVRRSLTGKGHRLGDAESSYLVHLCEEDETFPAGLNGLFHGLLADRRRRRVTLFTDRYGMHRLYYHEAKDAFYFAAEAKAILAVRPELRRVNARGLGEVITLGYVLENRTLFDGIHIMPGASRWMFEGDARVRKATYFQPAEWENQQVLKPEEFYEETRTVFSQILPRYLNGRDPVGVSLTGGLDTRMIMAWQRRPAGSLPCYTWGSSRRECRDVTVARKVARVCDQPHVVIATGRDFLSRFSHYADRAVFLTDGSVDVSLAPDVYLNERAREIAPVRITGLYGSQVLRRMHASRPVLPRPGLYQPDLLPRFEEARQTLQSVASGHPLSVEVFRQAPWNYYGSFSLEQTQVTMRSPFLDNELVKTVFRAASSERSSNDVSMRLIVDGNRALSRVPTDHGLTADGGLGTTLSYAVLRFLFRAEYAFDYGMPQWLARVDHMLRPLHLEKLFVGRHKPHNFRLWYRGELSGYVREMLLDPKALSRPYIDRRAMQQTVNGHTTGRRNYTTEIHRLLQLELVYRSFVDSPVLPRT